MTTFAKYFTRAKFDEFVAFCKANPHPGFEADTKIRDDWYDLEHKERHRAIVKPAMQFFKAKVKAGELKPSRNSAGRRMNTTICWDALATGKGEDHLKRWAMESMEQAFGSILLSPSSGLFELQYGDEDREIDFDKSYAMLIETFDSGNFPFHALSMHQQCGKTGEYLTIQFEDWTPVIGKINRATHKFEAVEPITQEPPVQTSKIEFKTGNVVGMDWFRGLDGAFRDWTDKNGVDKLPSVGSEAGVNASTKFYAESLGIVHVMVGNSSPNVYAGEGVIAVGNNWREYTADGRERYSDADEDGNPSEAAEEEYENAQENPPVGMVDEGTVCTDLWWVTLIERERLAEILLDQLGEERRAEIEAYVSSDFDVNLTVEPGKYTLHYDGYPSTFYSKLGDKTQFRIGTPYFALTKDPA